METQKTPSSHDNLEKENRGWRKQAPELILDSRAAVIKTVWCWHRNRNRAQWKRMENLDINLCTCDQWSVRKEARLHTKGEAVSSVNGAGLVLCPWICSSISWYIVYGNLNSTFILLLCENCINLNYIELADSAFQVCYILLLFYSFY